MKNYIGIHPWNTHGKVPIPSMLLLISLWKSIMGVNVNLTPFSFDVSAKYIDQKKKKMRTQSRHSNYIDGQMKEKTSLSDEAISQGI